MTSPEHGIMGALLSHLGLHQRYGARFTVVMIVASMAPDIDGVSAFWGRRVYQTYHRCVTHSLGGVAVLSLVIAAVCLTVPPIARWLKSHVTGDGKLHKALSALAGRRSEGNCLSNFPLIFVASLLVMVAHLFIDILYPWEIPLLWPFAGKKVVCAVVNWADPAILVIMLTAMFALSIFCRHTRLVAWVSLAVLGAYIGMRFFFPTVTYSYPYITAHSRVGGTQDARTARNVIRFPHASQRRSVVTPLISQAHSRGPVPLRLFFPRPTITLLRRNATVVPTEILYLGKDATCRPSISVVSERRSLLTGSSR